jgi:hypothetical protein
MIGPLIENLHADIALMQRYIERRSSAGFQDMARMLEAFAIPLFWAWKHYELVRMNQIQVNFPAIDLADSKNKAAVQVTITASATKVKKTLKVYEIKDLHSQYDHLYILGFNKISKVNVPAYCTIVGMDRILDDLLDRGDEDDVQTVVDAVKRHQSYSTLHPWGDRECLEIILHFVNRSAVTHMMSVEGSATEMVKGLKEVSELIGKGKVGREVKSKSMAEFDDPMMRGYLSGVMNTISEITAIVNGARAPQSDFVYLNEEASRRIDELKEHIANSSNHVAQQYGIPVMITVKHRWL